MPCTDFAFADTIAALEQLKQNPRKGESLAAVLEALDDRDARVRTYAVDALLDSYIDTEPQKVVDAIQNTLLHAKANGIDDGESENLLSLIARVVRSSSTRMDARRLATRALAIIALKQPERSLQIASLEELAVAVSKESFTTPEKIVTRGTLSPPVPFTANDLLSREEIRRLRDANRALLSGPDVSAAARIVDNWLQGTP